MGRSVNVTLSRRRGLPKAVVGNTVVAHVVSTDCALFACGLGSVFSKSLEDTLERSLIVFVKYNKGTFLCNGANPNGIAVVDVRAEFATGFLFEIPRDVRKEEKFVSF